MPLHDAVDINCENGATTDIKVQVRLFFFSRACFSSFHTLSNLLTCFCFFVLFHLAVPMRKCLGKHSCMSSAFPIAKLNDKLRLSTTNNNNIP